MKPAERLAKFDWELYCNKNDIESISLFGSYAKDEQTIASDLDLLVKFKKKISLLKIVQIQQDLESQLGMKVDLVTYGALSPHIGRHILESRKMLYEKAG